jgi:hypothetical protein
MRLPWLRVSLLKFLKKESSSAKTAWQKLAPKTDKLTIKPSSDRIFINLPPSEDVLKVSLADFYYFNY